MHKNPNGSTAAVGSAIQGRVEQALRAALTSRERGDIAEAVGWDDSQVSRFMSGQQGVTITKLETLLKAAGYTIANKKYIDALTTLSIMGAECAQCDQQSDCRKQRQK